MERDDVKGIQIEMDELKKLVEARTHRRIRDLDVEVTTDNVVLKGRAGSYHLKQLAQHGILDVFPGIHLINRIEVWN